MESKEDLKATILNIVTSLQGCKATELAAIFAANVAKMPSGQVNENQISSGFQESLDELIQEGELMEIEYTLPSMQYRVKSFLLPRGTLIVYNRLREPN